MMHQFVSAKADSGDAQLVRPTNWNAQHKGELYNYVFNGDVEVWAAGTAAAPSGWTLVGASATAAQNLTNFKHGLYSTDLARAGADASLTQRLDLVADQGPATWWRGRSLSFGCWVRCATASRARLVIDDGVGNSASPYHTGGGAFEWLTVTRTIDSGALEVTVKLQVDTGNATAQFDGATACLGALPTDFVPSVAGLGTWITPVFAAGDFTGNGSMTWTVAAGDVTSYQFCLIGRRMIVNFAIVTSTVGGTPNTELRIKIPLGLSAVKPAVAVIRIIDNGGAPAGGYVLASGTNLLCYRDLSGTANWTASTDATQVAGQIEFEV